MQARKTMHSLDKQQYVDRTPTEKSIRMTKDRDKWRKYVHGVANPRSRTAKEQKRLKNKIIRATAQKLQSR